MKIVFATGNKGKLREAREILGPEYEIVSPSDLGINEEPEETGSTFAENSLLKAEFFHRKTGLDCFADDSGLVVDALGGAPGIYSARYAGPGHDFAANIDKLHSELRKLGPGVDTKARFRCVVTLLKDGVPHYFEGKMEGHITYEKVGEYGFGYDPVFVPDAYPDKTVAQLSDEMKNSISHRGMALGAMADWLKNEAE